MRGHLVGLICLAMGLGAVAATGSADAKETKERAALGSADFREVIKRAKSRVFPAVVFVKVITESQHGGKKQRGEASGSGVIIDAAGTFLTNWHVVDEATEVRCLLHDGSAFHAEMLGTDQDTDLAVGRLKLGKQKRAFPFATLGDSTALTEGDFVMAMGAPWGLSRSVSLGIVSCTNRYLDGNSEYSLWIQTDAAISPGNSGGPLVNSNGEVIGLNTRGVMSGGDLGFAIPSETIRQVVAQIRKSGRVEWSWTGLLLQPVNDFNRDMYFGGDKGVIVAGTDPESPARRAGVKARDRLLAVNGKAVTGIQEEQLPGIRRRLGFLPKGEPAVLKILRGEETLEINIVPREKGEVEGEELELKRWDLSVKEINQFDNPQLYFHKKQGVFVYGVKYPGNAAKAGLTNGDILLKVGKTKIESLDDIKTVHATAIENVKKKHRIVLTLLRNGLRRQVVLEFSRDYERE